MKVWVVYGINETLELGSIQDIDFLKIYEDKDDAIQYYKPGAKGLVIRCHMMAEDEFTLYKMKHSPRHFSWLIPPRFIMLENKQIETLVKGKYGLSFIALYEYINSIIFKLYSDTEIQLEALADYVEYEWIF